MFYGENCELQHMLLYQAHTWCFVLEHFIDETKGSMLVWLGENGTIHH